MRPRCPARMGAHASNSRCKLGNVRHFRVGRLCRQLRRATRGRRPIRSPSAHPTLTDRPSVRVYLGGVLSAEAPGGRNSSLDRALTELVIISHAASAGPPMWRGAPKKPLGVLSDTVH